MTPRIAPTLAAQLARPRGDAVALRLPAGDITWGEVRAAVDAASQQLARAGVGWRDRVLMRCGDDVSRLLVSLAVQRIGAAVVPVNPATIGSELAFVVDKADPVAVVADEDLLSGLDVPDGAALLINEGGALSARTRRATHSEPRDPDPGDAASILFTSGSSARPRAAVLSHHAHVMMARDFAAILDVSQGDSFLLLSPLFHVGGWSTAALPALATGCSLVIPGTFSASRFWDDVERWQPTLWTTGLAFIEMVAARGGEPPSRLPFRHVISNLRPDTWRLGSEQLGLPLGTYYGLTENDGRGTIALDIEDYRPGFVGRRYIPSDGVRVVADGEELAPGEVGEIELHSECVMAEYFRDEEATRAVLRRGRWVATGDLGHLDAHGRLFFQGRLKNMIKRSGENVAAEEVELFLMAHPEVRDAIVVAVPDRVREEEVKALVVREPGSALSAEDLHGYCRADMAAFKVPRYLQFVDELPRTVSGKPDIGTVRRTMATPEGCWDSEEHGVRAAGPPAAGGASS